MSGAQVRQSLYVGEKEEFPWNQQRLNQTRYMKYLSRNIHQYVGNFFVKGAQK